MTDIKQAKADAMEIQSQMNDFIRRCTSDFEAKHEGLTLDMFLESISIADCISPATILILSPKVC